MVGESCVDHTSAHACKSKEGDQLQEKLLKEPLVLMLGLADMLRELAGSFDDNGVWDDPWLVD